MDGSTKAIPQCWGHGSFARCESGCYGLRTLAWCIYGTLQGAVAVEIRKIREIVILKAVALQKKKKTKKTLLLVVIRGGDFNWRINTRVQ